MSCNHWLCERRVLAIARRLRLPVVAARRCTATLILADGSQLKYDFAAGVVVGPHPDPFRFVFTEIHRQRYVWTMRGDDREGVNFGPAYSLPEGTKS